MPLVTSLDGKVYDLDEEILAKYCIPDDDVQKLGLLPPLPTTPALPRQPSVAVKQEVVRLRAGPVGSILIDINLGGS